MDKRPSTNDGEWIYRVRVLERMAIRLSGVNTVAYEPPMRNPERQVAEVKTVTAPRRGRKRANTACADRRTHHTSMHADGAGVPEYHCELSDDVFACACEANSDFNDNNDLQRAGGWREDEDVARAARFWTSDCGRHHVPGWVSLLRDKLSEATA